MIVPPSRIFSFPDLGTYNGGVYDHTDRGVRVYDWSMKPYGFGGEVGATYHVFIYPSAERVKSDIADAKRKMVQAFDGMTQVREINYAGSPLADPALHAWGIYLPLIHCNITAAFVYRNLGIALGVTSQDDQDACDSKVGWALRLQILLLRAAQAYAQKHVGARSINRFTGSVQLAHNRPPGKILWGVYICTRTHYDARTEHCIHGDHVISLSALHDAYLSISRPDHAGINVNMIDADIKGFDPNLPSVPIMAPYNIWKSTNLYGDRPGVVSTSLADWFQRLEFSPDPGVLYHVHATDSSNGLDVGSTTVTFTP